MLESPSPKNVAALPDVGHAGALVISLDFELYWGVRDQLTLDQYRENLLGVRQAIPAMLELFERYGIHATWATVGFLFFGSRAELTQGLPEVTPQYAAAELSPYPYLAEIGLDESSDPFHFGESLVKLIGSYAHQELASHTFSHYYCQEAGQTLEAFRADLSAARRAAERLGIKLHSLVFPRNQFNSAYVQACEELGISSYRGNERSWIYEPRSHRDETWWMRGSRLLDSYVNLSGRHCYEPAELAKTFPFDIPSSRFLRPYNPSLAALEPIRFRRITSDMTLAAKRSRIFHLWWHPHNFGKNLKENISFLESVLRQFQMLQAEYGMETLTMQEVSSKLERLRSHGGIS